jgi:zinc protease
MRATISLLLSLCLLAFLPPASAEKQAPPEGGKAKDFHLPVFRTFTLANGLGVTLVPYGIVPKATIAIVVRTGALNEAPDQVWLSDLTIDYLKEGTASRSAQKIAEEAADMGGEIAATAGNDESRIGGSVLSESAPQFVKLVADLLENPSFPESELDRLQAGYLRKLAVAKTQPSALAEEAFHHILYGDHPYGRNFPTEAMVRAYTVPVVRKFYEQNFGATRTHVYVAGVFDEKRVEKAIREGFGDWKAGSEILTRVPKPVSEKAVYVVDRPGSVQSTIFVGLPVISPTHKDWIGLQITDALLGGAFFSRITANIREDKGYTYSPYSQVETNYRDACWYEQADVSTDVTGAALKEILSEIDRLAEKAPSADEVKGIQNYYAGIFVLRNSSPRGIINQLSFLRLHGLDRSYLDTYVQKVFGVTPEDVRKLAAGQLPSKDMTIVIVGDLEKIKEQIAPFGKVTRLE